MNHSFRPRTLHCSRYARAKAEQSFIYISLLFSEREAKHDWSKPGFNEEKYSYIAGIMNSRSCLISFVRS